MPVKKMWSPVVRTWAVENLKSGNWLHAEEREDQIELSWVGEWSGRTLFVVRKIAKALAAQFHDTRLVRVTRRKVTRHEQIEILRRYVLPIHLDVARHLLKTGSLKRSALGLRMPEEMVLSQSFVAVEHLSRAGFRGLADRLEYARGR